MCSTKPLIQTPRRYTPYILWLVSRLYSHLPELGGLRGTVTRLFLLPARSQRQGYELAEVQTPLAGRRIVGLVVFGQQSHRILTNVPYIVVGQGLSGATFKLFFLDPHYNPLFYVQTFLLAGNHIVLDCPVIFGLPLIFTNRGLRYYFSIMAMLLMLLTNFLPNLPSAMATSSNHFLSFRPLQLPSILLLSSGTLSRKVPSGWWLRRRVSLRWLFSPRFFS